jgi:HTH-type transcriptional regulator, sugar sensing transcriptional regulator
MYQDLLIQNGLNKNEAVIYEYLLKNGDSPAGLIIKKTPLKRGVVYNALASLTKKDLIAERKRNKIAIFSPAHPDKLAELAESREIEIAGAKRALKSSLPTLVSDFNLISNRPGVRYFEGLDGVKKVLDDTLTAKEVIYSYADVEAVVKYIEDINRSYVKKRDRLKIKKRVITIDSPFLRKYLKNYYKQVTDIRFIDHSLYPFSSVVQIYDGRVAYISLSKKNHSAIIVSDKNIYRTEKSIFDFVWQHSKSFDQLGTLSKPQKTVSLSESKK